jgi:hypothetical protein
MHLGYNQLERFCFSGQPLHASFSVVSRHGGAGGARNAR